MVAATWSRMSVLIAFLLLFCGTVLSEDKVVAEEGTSDVSGQATTLRDAKAYILPAESPAKTDENPELPSEIKDPISELPGVDLPSEQTDTETKNASMDLSDIDTKTGDAVGKPSPVQAVPVDTGVSVLPEADTQGNGELGTEPVETPDVPVPPVVQSLVNKTSEAEIPLGQPTATVQPAEGPVDIPIPVEHSNGGEEQWKDSVSAELAPIVEGVNLPDKEQQETKPLLPIMPGPVILEELSKTDDVSPDLSAAMDNPETSDVPVLPDVPDQASPGGAEPVIAIKPRVNDPEVPTSEEDLDEVETTEEDGDLESDEDLPEGNEQYYINKYLNGDYKALSETDWENYDDDSDDDDSFYEDGYDDDDDNDDDDIVDHIDYKDWIHKISLSEEDSDEYYDDIDDDSFWSSDEDESWENTYDEDDYDDDEDKGWLPEIYDKIDDVQILPTTETPEEGDFWAKFKDEYQDLNTYDDYSEEEKEEEEDGEDNTYETTDDYIDAGKDMMQSPHHFDSTLGAFAGTKVFKGNVKEGVIRPFTDRREDLLDDQYKVEEGRTSMISFYSWMLMLTLFVLSLAFFIHWNKKLMSGYISRWTGKKPKTEEVKNLLSHEYA